MLAEPIWNRNANLNNFYKSLEHRWLSGLACIVIKTCMITDSNDRCVSEAVRHQDDDYSPQEHSRPAKATLLLAKIDTNVSTFVMCAKRSHANNM